MARNPVIEDQLMAAEIDEVKKTFRRGAPERVEKVAEAEESTSIATADDLVAIYSLEDGTVSVINVQNLAKKLARNDAGKRFFSLEPTNPDWQYRIDAVTGWPVKLNSLNMLCHLHPEHPNRERYDALGLQGKECRKANIPGDFQVRMHMTRRHKVEWDTIQEAERRDREERLAGTSDATMAALVKLLEQRGVLE